MSTTTTNYGLIKPELTDAADITAYNENWDTIDEKLKLGETAKTNIDNHINNNSNPHNVTAEEVGAVNKSGDTMTGTLDIEVNSPTINLKDKDSGGSTRMNKNASPTVDYGSYFADYTSDGKRDAFVVRRATTLKNKLSFSVEQDDGTFNSYAIYGEHNSPIARGSYVGNGKYNYTNRNRIEFNFIPKTIIIQSDTGLMQGIFIRPSDDSGTMTNIVTHAKSDGNEINMKAYQVKVIWIQENDSKTVYWYSENSASHQLNDGGKVYNYVAFG